MFRWLDRNRASICRSYPLNTSFLIGNCSLLHPTPDIEGTHPQELMSISDGVRGLVAADDQANGPYTMLFPHPTAGSALISPLNLRDELNRLMQARTDFQYQFGPPADVAVQVKTAPTGYSMPVPEVDGRLDLGSLSANSTDHGRGRCKSVRSPIRSHSRAMVQH